MVFWLVKSCLEVIICVLLMVDGIFCMVLGVVDVVFVVGVVFRLVGCL